MIKMIKITMIDGIPCIFLDEDIFWTDEAIKKESEKVIMPTYFTNIQETKNSSYFNKVLEELKKKFRENEK